MATLWIREYKTAYVAPGSGGLVQVAVEPGTDQTPVTFTTTSPSAAFGGSTAFIAVIGSAAFHYVVADAPVATTGALKVPADTLLFLAVTPGQKIAAVTA